MTGDTTSDTVDQEPTGEPDEKPVEAEVIADADVSGEVSAEVVLDIELPEDAEQAQQVLVDEVIAARGRGDAFLDDLRRVAADFENYRKRTAREFDSITERASERLVVSLLPVLDSFEAALAIETQSETEEKLLGGMRSTRDQLVDILAREGLEVIPAMDEPFDPEVHEAVMTSGDGSTLHVSQELRRGYRLKGRVLRPALVALESNEA